MSARGWIKYLIAHRYSDVPSCFQISVLLGINRCVPLKDQEHRQAHSGSPTFLGTLNHNKESNKEMQNLKKEEAAATCLLNWAVLKILVYETVTHTGEEKEKSVRRHKMHEKIKSTGRLGASVG